MKGALNVLSTFSGVGGMDLGLARAGWRHVGLCERDEYRRAVLAERFSGVELWDDVREVAASGRARQLAGVVGSVGSRSDGGRGRSGAKDGNDRVDLLCGGFPCQDLSVAGRRAGLAGERSGLFFEFARIAESVRPEWLLIENVPGLLSSNGGRDFGELLGSLADIGYGVAWRILDSRFFGVPQRRRRVFIVAHHSGGRLGAERAGAVLAVGSGCGGHPAAGGEAGAGASSGPGGSIAHTLRSSGFDASEDGTGRGTPMTIVPPLAGTLGSGQKQGGRTTDLDNHGAYIVSAAVTSKWAKGSGGPAGDEVQNLTVERTCEACVDGFHPECDGCDNDGHPCVCPCGPETPHGIPTSSVRRLTPRECERLQGFPDDWTLIDWKGKPAADSRRYAACGDAVTVPVAEWLGMRIAGAM